MIGSTSKDCVKHDVEGYVTSFEIGLDGGSVSSVSHVTSTGSYSFGKKTSQTTIVKYGFSESRPLIGIYGTEIRSVNSLGVMVYNTACDPNAPEPPDSRSFSSSIKITEISGADSGKLKEQISANPVEEEDELETIEEDAFSADITVTVSD